MYLRKTSAITSGDISKISEVGGISMDSFDQDVVEYFKEKGITLKKSGDNFFYNSTKCRYKKNFS